MIYICEIRSRVDEEAKGFFSTVIVGRDLIYFHFIFRQQSLLILVWNFVLFWVKKRLIEERKWV